MSDYKNFTCPSCGAPGKVNRHIAMGTCEYCGSAFYFEDEAVFEHGKMSVLAESDSIFYVGATGTIGKTEFKVMGRVRYGYDGGYWDEWYLLDSDRNEIWISEDEMEFSLEKSVKDPGNIPTYDILSPGDVLNVGGVSVSVDEKDIARLEGIEGSLPMNLEADRAFPYAEASQGENMLTIEYTSDGLEVYKGEWISMEDIELDNPKFDYNAEWMDA